MDPATIFGQRKTVEQVEEGTELAPKFDEKGLIPAVTTDFTSGELPCLLPLLLLPQRPGWRPD